MKFRLALALAVLFAATGFARAAPDPTASGFWEAQDDDGNPTAWFLFTDKDGVYSARLVKGFKKPGDDKPPQMVCTKCPGKKKGAHIMGLTLFWGMKRDGLAYRDGSVLDPRDGTIYHAQMDLSDDGKELSVRGYVGIPLLGKTQVWRRLPEDAMKAEDIPKEIYANGEEAPGDKAERHKSHGQSTAERSKSHKMKPKADEAAPAETPSATPDKDAQ